MPLDSHSYLVSQGWSGRGSGLRNGAISRPLSIPQKRTLAGVGKDRDEAFPFWDHLFSAAADSIRINISNESDIDNDTYSPSTVMFKRTTTGILSNRRPVSGTPVSGSTTPTPTEGSRYGLIASAKRDAARRGLYSRFFRGPVLGPEVDGEVLDAVELMKVEGKMDLGKNRRYLEPEIHGDEARDKKDLDVEKITRKRKRINENGSSNKSSTPQDLEGTEGKERKRELRKAKREAKRLVAEAVKGHCEPAMEAGKVGRDSGTRKHQGSRKANKKSLKGMLDTHQKIQDTPRHHDAHTQDRIKKKRTSLD